MLWTLEDPLALIRCPELFMRVLQDSKVYIITSRIHIDVEMGGSKEHPYHHTLVECLPPRWTCGTVGERTRRGKT